MKIEHPLVCVLIDHEQVLKHIFVSYHFIVLSHVKKNDFISLSLTIVSKFINEIWFFDILKKLIPLFKLYHYNSKNE